MLYITAGVFITVGWVEFENGLLWQDEAVCTFDWQAAIFLRFDCVGPSPIHPPAQNKTLTLEIFGIWPQYFYTVTIHTFITLCFMNSEGLLRCTQTSFNLFSWSNPLKQSVGVCAIKAGWFPFRKFSSMDTCSQCVYGGILKIQLTLWFSEELKSLGSFQIGRIRSGKASKSTSPSCTVSSPLPLCTGLSSPLFWFAYQLSQKDHFLFESYSAPM